MSEELHRRLLLTKESREKNRIEQQLATAGIPAQFDEDYSPPLWIIEERTRFLVATTSADFTTPPAPSDQLGQWVEAIADQLGMGTSIIAGTGLDNFPWVRIEPLKERWGEILMEVLGKNLTLTSGNSEILLFLFEEEHEYLAFTSSETRHGPTP